VEGALVLFRKLHIYVDIRKAEEVSLPEITVSSLDSALFPSSLSFVRNIMNFQKKRKNK
jgi:hypothetical protein